MKNHLCRTVSCLLLCILLAGTAAPAASAAKLTFRDVPAGHWAADEIEQCVSLGLFGGINETQFGLGQSMTRRSFAVVLCRFFGWETPAPERSTYSDVPADAWYAGAVEAAYAHGAFTAQSKLFRPADHITREELAVALVRALGYTHIAGLAGTLSSPFTDVTTNAGYITMAYNLGLTNGTTATTFSPNKVATREQTAVIFIRLYNKLHGNTISRTGILSTGNAFTALDGMDALIVDGAAASENTLRIKGFARQEAVLSAVQSAGVPNLLYIEGDASLLRAKPAAAAAMLADGTKAAGYSGILLDIPGLNTTHTAALTALAQALRAALGSRPLYLVTEAPVWQGTPRDGYDYAALSAVADRLILRVAPRNTVSGKTVSAPMEPLEDVYFALLTLREAGVDSGKLSLLLTTTGSAWEDTTRVGSPSAGEIEALAADDFTKHYSARYACAYLSSGTSVIWYLDGQAAAARGQLLRLFGVDHVLLSDLSGISSDFLQGLE